MKSNFAKCVWAAAAVLLISGVGQSAWALTCTHEVHVRNTVPGETIQLEAVKHQLSGYPYVYGKIDSAILYQSEVHTAVFNLPFDDCSSLKWRVKFTYVCKGKTQAHTAETSYVAPDQYADLYVNVTDCEGHVDYQRGSFPQREMEINGSALRCPKPPEVLLYPDEHKNGQPVVISNQVITDLGSHADTSGTSLNDWAASLEVTSGTWRFFKHADFEGPQLYVAAPHTINKLDYAKSTWSQISYGIFAHALTSLKPISCDSKLLGRNYLGEKVRMGYIYGFGDKGCLQKAATGYRDGINIHYWDQCNGHTQENRAWYWDPATGYIHNLENPEYCVYKPAARFKAGDNIRLWRCDDGAAENKAWDYNVTTHQITPRDERGKGFCIDHSGNNVGAKIHLWSCSPNDGNTNNQWKITWGLNGN